MGVEDTPQTDREPRARPWKKQKDKPMPTKSPYRFNVVSESDGQKVTFCFDTEDEMYIKAGKVIHASSAAKEYIDFAILSLEHNDPKELVAFALRAFFLLPPNLHDSIRSPVAAKLKIIRHALGQNTAIKIGNLKGDETGTPQLGYVTDCFKPATKFCHTTGIKDKREVRYGAIHRANAGLSPAGRMFPGTTYLLGPRRTQRESPCR
jgi:hypothetical protein